MHVKILKIQMLSLFQRMTFIKSVSNISQKKSKNLAEN